MKKLIVLSGAGISAESGIKTFRDSGGLWEGYDVMTVASPQGWSKNPELVNEFYNLRRLQLAEVEPNAGHLALKELENHYDTCIVTQNVDDLHERAGSSKIIHLHGELRKVRSVIDENDIIDIGYRKIQYGKKSPNGHLLRPHIVWFGEAVPMIESALKEVMKADVLLIVGTSLEVYPAAGLIHEVPRHCEIFLIDPNRHESLNGSRIKVIQGTAAQKLPLLVNDLISAVN
jgi:NAD-dependent deacetylase